MSPILVRPVREQLEHDRLIRFLLNNKYKKRYDAMGNAGEEHSASVKIGLNTFFPDIVLAEGKKLAGLVEVETGESVNNLEALAQWVHFAKARVPFHLYVPVTSYDSARRLCELHHVRPAEVWTYRSSMDGFDLMRVQQNPVTGGSGRMATFERAEPKPVVIEKPEPKPEPAPKTPIPAKVAPKAPLPVKPVDMKGMKDVKAPGGLQGMKDVKRPEDVKDPKNAKDAKGLRDVKDAKAPNGPKSARDLRSAKDANDAKHLRGAKDKKPVRAARPVKAAKPSMPSRAPKPKPKAKNQNNSKKKR